jgi:hypothetical protein
MSESIAVYYEPLGNIAGVPYNHMTLVYTNNAGQQSFLTSGPTNSVAGPGLVQLSDAASQASSGQATAWGTIFSNSGLLTPTTAPGKIYDAATPNVPYASATVATGADLSGTFAAMIATEQQLMSRGLGYSPLTQNSNSFACTAIASQGLEIPLPAITMYGAQFSPGCGNDLLSATGSFQKVSLTNDASGNTNLTITTTYKNGAPADNISITTNDAAATSTLSVVDHNQGGGIQAGETYSVTPTSTNASVSGSVGTLTLENTGVQISAGATALIIGGGDAFNIGANAKVTITDGDGSRSGFQPGQGRSENPDTETIGGTGVNLSLNGIATQYVNGNSATITNNLSFAPLDVNGTADFITGTNTGAITNFADGLTGNTVGGLGSVYGSYGSFDTAPSSSLNIVGDNETWGGSSTDYFHIIGLDDIYTGLNSQINPGPNTSLTVSNSNYITITNSDLSLTANNSYLYDNTNNLTDLNIFGNYNSTIGTGVGDYFNYGGSNDTSNLVNNSTTWYGTTTGDLNSGYGSTNSYISYPDPVYFPPGFDTGDPIILNLKGSPVQTQNLTNSTAYFDIQNTGVKDHTGWGTAGEGYLMYDPGNTNAVTGEKSLLADFADMSRLDSNHDGVLNSLDTAWSHLKVWVDSTGSATFTNGSLSTVDQLGIASIKLNPTQEKVNSNNNTILEDSIFTWKNGATGDIAGVELHYHAASVVTASSGGGGGNGGTCVHYRSLLPGGGTAGEIEVGSRMELADESTLEATNGFVTYSERKTAPGYRIVTASGIALVCSDTAPIPTREGLILAPALMGHEVAVRKDEGGSSLVGWEKVASVTSVGTIEIQHISINDKCYWAGESKDAFILHHNKTTHPLP